MIVVKKEMKQVTRPNYIYQLIVQENALNRDFKKIKELLRSKNLDEKDTFILFKKLINKYPSNPKVLKSFLYFLLSLNDDSLIEKFSLKEIERFYKKACATNKFDVELNMDYFYFVHNVLDKEAETLKLYNNYKKNILSSFKEFGEIVKK